MIINFQSRVDYVVKTGDFEITISHTGARATACGVGVTYKSIKCLYSDMAQLISGVKMTLCVTKQQPYSCRGNRTFLFTNQLTIVE